MLVFLVGQPGEVEPLTARLFLAAGEDRLRSAATWCRLRRRETSRHAYREIDGRGDLADAILIQQRRLRLSGAACCLLGRTIQMRSDVFDRNIDGG